MKKILMGALVLSLSLGVSACGSNSEAKQGGGVNKELAEKQPEILPVDVDGSVMDGHQPKGEIVQPSGNDFSTPGNTAKFFITALKNNDPKKACTAFSTKTLGEMEGLPDKCEGIFARQFGSEHSFFGDVDKMIFSEAPANNGEVLVRVKLDENDPTPLPVMLVKEGEEWKIDRLEGI